MVARRGLDPRQVREICFAQGGQLHKPPPPIAQAAQLVLHADVVGDGSGFKDELEDKHGESKEEKEQEEALC
eukprot:3183828-Prymnesium_polylepis.2